MPHALPCAVLRSNSVSPRPPPNNAPRNRLADRSGAFGLCAGVKEPQGFGRPTAKAPRPVPPRASGNATPGLQRSQAWRTGSTLYSYMRGKDAAATWHGLGLRACPVRKTPPPSHASVGSCHRENLVREQAAVTNLNSLSVSRRSGSTFRADQRSTSRIHRGHRLPSSG